MSIFAGPTEPPKEMPTKLKVVIGFNLLSIATDVYTAIAGSATTTTYVRIAIGVAVVAFLLRGSDSVRALVRFFAVLGMIGGLVILLQGVQIGLAFKFGMIAVGAGVFAIVANAFTFWALAQEDVHVWMATRTFKRMEGP